MHEACLKSPLCALLAITNLFFLFTCRRVLPITFLKKRLQDCDRTKKHVKALTYNRDICLPKSSKSKNGDIKIPRGHEICDMLSRNGLIGKVRLSSEMTERKSWMKSAQYLQRQSMMIQISDLQSCKFSSYANFPAVHYLFKMHSKLN